MNKKIQKALDAGRWIEAARQLNAANVAKPSGEGIWTREDVLIQAAWLRIMIG